MPYASAATTTPSELSVLVIEDDTTLLRTLRDILDRRGYHPLTANSAREGLALVEQELPAVALVDLKLPDMDGVEVIDRLSALSRLTQTIVLTGNASIESALRALRQRTYDYLVKPVPPDKLLTTIDRAGERWQRRRAEEALRQSEERAQLLLEHISDVVMVVDDALVIRYVSPSVRHLLDYQPSELVGRAALDVVHPEDAAATETFLRGAFRRTGLLQAHLRVRPRNGDWRVLEVGVNSLAGRTDMGGILLTGRDVTERRRMEQALQQAQRMDSIGQLAGGVAHDFNNILTAILGFSEILIDDAPSDSDTRLDLEAIQKAAQHGASLSRQLLAFSRRQMLDLKVLDLGQVVRDFERMIARVLGEHIAWAAQSDPDLWHVKADRGQLEQVLMNLAVNARDAMPDGGALTIETRNATIEDSTADRTRAAQGAYVRFSVRDTGVGMDADTQARIFEPFFTTKPAGRGTGLGLATVYGIVKQSGGFVEVESEPGQGTAFHVFLPAVADTVADRAAHGAPRVTTPVETASILLIEDDAALRRLLARSLERVGHRVRDAADSQGALAILNQEPRIDLLITDAVLPGQSGPLLARQIEADRPTLRVLFISGYSDDAILRLGLLNEQEAFLQKPFGPRTFVQKVQQILRA
jgi:two-component system, cell cycle sensor histidine kinase and response regulator CckA